MTTNQFSRIIAACVGCFLLVSALSEASGLILSAETGQFMGRSPTLYLYALMPAAGALLFAVLLYRYASQMSVENIKPTEIEILAVGIKLMGFYSLLRSVSYTIAFLAGITIQSHPGAMAVSEPMIRVGIAGTSYAIIAYVMVFRTQWLIARVSNEK